MTWPLFYEDVWPSPWRRSTADYINPGEYVRFRSRTTGELVKGFVMRRAGGLAVSILPPSGSKKALHVYMIENASMRIVDRLDTELWDG